MAAIIGTRRNCDDRRDPDSKLSAVRISRPVRQSCRIFGGRVIYLMENLFKQSDRVAGMHTSSTLKAAQTAANLRAQGVSVIDLTVGEPDFDTPQFIKDFAIEGLNKGFTKYTPSSGLKIFQESIAAFYQSEFVSIFSPAEVMASCGGKQALFNAACTVLNPGDEVLIPQPYW